MSTLFFSIGPACLEPTLLPYPNPAIPYLVCPLSIGPAYLERVSGLEALKAGVDDLDMDMGMEEEGDDDDF